MGGVNIGGLFDANKDGATLLPPNGYASFDGQLPREGHKITNVDGLIVAEDVAYKGFVTADVRRIRGTPCIWGNSCRHGANRSRQNALGEGVFSRICQRTIVIYSDTGC